MVKLMEAQTKIIDLSKFNSIDDNIRKLSMLPYKNSPYKSRNWGHQWHSLCSYPSKLKPAIAYHLVEYFSKPNDIILDPFSGIGTIPFEACLNGRVGIGIDLNPLAFHATNAKVSAPSKQEVIKEFNALEIAINIENKFLDTVPKEIEAFYHPKTLHEILKARDYLLTEFKKNPRPSISFLITNIAHILHGNRPYALSRRSHNIIPIPPKGEFEYKSLIEHTRERIEKYLNIQIPRQFIRGRSILGSIFDSYIENESIDAIITSPPFFGNTEFLRQNRVRIWFCGWDYEQQSAEKSKFVDYMNLSVYEEIFDKFYNILRNNKICILHLGVVKTKDMALSILPYAEKSGFKKIGLIYEDTSNLETHGRTDRGGTHKHQFLILKKQ
jgi:DNA modification methylase